MEGRSSVAPALNFIGGRELEQVLLGLMSRTGATAGVTTDEDISKVIIDDEDNDEYYDYDELCNYEEVHTTIMDFTDKHFGIYHDNEDIFRASPTDPHFSIYFEGGDDRQEGDNEDKYDNEEPQTSGATTDKKAVTGKMYISRHLLRNI